MLVIDVCGFASLDLAFYFVIYSFLGWVLESFYAWTEEGHFVNRGFLNGPFCPIYGFGALILIIFLQPISGNIPLLFIGAAVLTSALEYLTGFVLEKMFHQKWWDYSNRRFNLKGRICLRFSLYWGIGALIMLKCLQPEISGIVQQIPYDLGVLIIAGMAGYFAVDLVHTVRSVVELKSVIQQMQLMRLEALDTVELVRETSLEALEQVRNDLRDSYERLLGRATAGTRRLFKAFPDLGTRQHENLFRELREKLIQKHRQDRD